ncbi:hypothetical protein GSI_10113 [Ganoderma sinense ZZ0214-1]|uniref:DUF6533 domain-containing protein n=1 Tax=Ganoderma sinense ZZ0214-1 TaxID=1077348 RepID=A0A2G8RZP5_9APHY|nr:hypothetical protein GSI_10113 [Ganoderma sinense ZZ0214-1]
MSSSTTSSENASVDLLSDLRTSNYFILLAIVPVLYDWVVTLPREVEAFWTGAARPFSTSLYFANRLVSLGMAVVEVVGLAAPLSTEACRIRGEALDIPDSASMIIAIPGSCAGYSFVGLVLSFISYIPLAAFTASRAYALSQRRLLSFVIFVVLLAPLPMNAAMFQYLHPKVAAPPVGCTVVDSTPPVIGNITLTFFMLVLQATNGTSAGVVYFLVVIVLNTADLVFTGYSLLTSPELSGRNEDATINDVTSLTTIIRVYFPPILISRFLLDLQEAYQRKVVWLDSENSLHASRDANVGGMSSIGFTAALGALGATVEPMEAAGWIPSDNRDDHHEEHVDSEATVDPPYPMAQAHHVALEMETMGAQHAGWHKDGVVLACAQLLWPDEPDDVPAQVWMGEPSVVSDRLQAGRMSAE